MKRRGVGTWSTKEAKAGEELGVGVRVLVCIISALQPASPADAARRVLHCLAPCAMHCLAPVAQGARRLLQEEHAVAYCNDSLACGA